MSQTGVLFQQEVAQGDRFEFGKNWARFLETLNDQRIEDATNSLRDMLEVEDLRGLRFLDAGCGSGLFSLAARRLGAEVHSFDYDPNSVACTSELRRRFFPDDAEWAIEQASALDQDYLESLGQFDVVYSWGVLHHTGDMWRALDYVSGRCQMQGAKLFIAIYNDQGRRSGRWRKVKKTYNQLPNWLHIPFVILIMGPWVMKSFLVSILRLRVGEYIRSWTGYGQAERGMNRWHDMVDWVGGYPFEVATPDAIFDFYRARGFVLRQLRTVMGGSGCNEFVFEKIDPERNG